MKKTFFLTKGLNKFSNLQIEDLQNVRGGAIGEANDDIIYYPTSGGGKKCPPGQIWSDKFQMCMARAIESPHDVKIG